MADKNKARNSILFTICAVTLLAIAAGSYANKPRTNKKLHAHIGRVLADESVALLKPGGKVTIIARDTEAFLQPAMTILLGSVRDELKRKKAEVRSVEEIQLDPIRPTEVPSGDFYELLRRLPAEDVIISLMGPPVLAPDERAKLGQPKVKVVALCTGSVAEYANPRELMRAGLLHIALVNKAPATDPAQAFDNLYSVLRGPTL